MADEARLRAAIDRAHKMSEWAQGPDGFFDLLQALENSYFEEWTESDHDDQSLREHIFHRIRVLRDMRTVMTKVITGGKTAEAELKHLQSLQDVKPFH